MNIDNLMTRDVHTCAPTDTLEHAARVMWERDCGVLPVVDDRRRVVGMVTDRDICMGSLLQGAPLRDCLVSSVMSTQLHTCTLGDDVQYVERIMRERQIRRIPVVTGDLELLGIVTLGDLARSSQSSAFQKALGGLFISRTLAAVSEPRAPREVAAE